MASSIEKKIRHGLNYGMSGTRIHRFIDDWVTQVLNDPDHSEVLERSRDHWIKYYKINKADWKGFGGTIIPKCAHNHDPKTCPYCKYSNE